MIAQLQAISRIVDSKDYSFIEDNNLTREMFGDYAEVFDFIVDHYNQYKTVPDSITLLEKFDYLENIEFDEVELIGLCTDICVVSNALLIKARFPEREVSVDSSCCAGVTPATHEAALTTMKMCQINVR